ncbi:ATP-binding protein [Sphingomonas adhaesiva]|uniref:ATP-binding protein n=1 Tax=Sphingomonas adhaesiva TaxID=28212 RepID=UPI002FFA2772
MLNEPVTAATPSIGNDPYHSWGNAAPKGGRAVLQRILKEGTKVPLFLGQTLVNSLRDVGYNDTISAVCEHVDNSLQWDASEVRVYFHEQKDKAQKSVDVMIVDNGSGMAPHVLQVATSFGGSMVYENRSSIGRYGVGMKAAALSMSPVMELYSWQDDRAFYRMILDVNEISNNRSNLIELPEPEFLAELPSSVTRIMSRPMVYPKNPNETQDLLAQSEDDVYARLGSHGTIVMMPDCDRLTYKSAKTLVDHAVKEMARVYRKHLEKGVAIYVNNRRLEAVDPTFWMLSARHAKVEGLEEKRSRLVQSWTRIEVPLAEGSPNKAPVSVRLYRLPIEEWGQLPKKVLKSDMGVYDDFQVSFMRADREVHAGPVAALNMRVHGDTKWMRLQIDFPAELDEAFGVAMNKQGVRPKKFVYDTIMQIIRDDVLAVKKSIAASRVAGDSDTPTSPAGEAERRASATDALQGRQLPAPAPQTAEEEAMLAENLRGLAAALKRDGETDEQAFERVQASTYLTQFKHDEYWPFYHADYQYGKVILTLNTAHPFYTKLYQPLVKLVAAASVDGVDDEETEGPVDCEANEVVVSLQLLLMSLARTQGQMTAGSEGDERRELFDTLRRQWSDNLRVQLQAN